MTPPSMESIFLILSGVILVAGVLYWLWSHIQLTQKKVQLLENAVFELRGMLANSGGGASGPGAPASPTRQVQVIPATAATAAAFEQMNGGGVAGTVDADDTDADWGDENAHKSTPLGDLDAPVLEVADDLQPGGRAGVSTMDIDMDVAAAVVAPDDDRAEQFRKLFVVKQDSAAHVSPSQVSSSGSAAVEADVAPAAKSPESLESMPVKELRRLAEQRGIAGAADMRKKEILAALRQQVSMSLTLTESSAPATFEEGEGDSDIREVAIESAEILE